jgi:hypothetical protein
VQSAAKVSIVSAAGVKPGKRRATDGDTAEPKNCETICLDAGVSTLTPADETEVDENRGIPMSAITRVSNAMRIMELDLFALIKNWADGLWVFIEMLLKD